MAHILKYFKELNSHGHLWRIEFLQDTEDILIPIEIGPVLQSLRLIVQGDQADIDTPIVKTSLEMSFIDAPGLEIERKCGYWEEFYTSNSTEFMVCLYKDGVKEWSGYITPDSFEEDLRYRGSISIIARDNLGTLNEDSFELIQDKDVGTTKRITALTIIEKALKKCNCAMQLRYNKCSFPLVTDDEGTSQGERLAFNLLIEQTILVDKTWQECLNDVLYSIGAVIRYVGKNTLYIIPLRDIPKADKENWWDVPIEEVKFISYGHRELVPGIKAIEEIDKFEIVNDTEEDKRLQGISYQGGDPFVLSCTGLRFKDGPIYDSGNNYTIPVHSYRLNNSDKGVISLSSSLLDVEQYERYPGESSERYGAWDDKNTMYFAVNANTSEKPLTFTQKVYVENVSIDISFILSKPVSLSPDERYVMNSPVLAINSSAVGQRLKMRISIKNGSTVLYFNGSSWQESDYIINIKISEALFTSFFSVNPKIQYTGIISPMSGTLAVEILEVNVSDREMPVRVPCKGMYIRIQNVDIMQKYTGEIQEKLKLTTHYSDRYSVRLNREPKLAVNTTPNQSVAYVVNSLLCRNFLTNELYGPIWWTWLYSRDVEVIDFEKNQGMIFPRLIHQQLLSYHAKPNNLLSGELVISESCQPFSSIWSWNNTLHTLLSGSFNILTGRIENAVLREYKRYDHLWETWIENEDIKIDGAETRRIDIVVHVYNNKTIGPDDIFNLPDWISYDGHIIDEINNDVIFNFICSFNSTALERQAIFRIDTAYIRVTQIAAGDYGIDYGEDYS